MKPKAILKANKKPKAILKANKKLKAFLYFIKEILRYVTASMVEHSAVYCGGVGSSSVQGVRHQRDDTQKKLVNISVCKLLCFRNCRKHFTGM